ncbi:MAG: P63C domain-containing protein [Sphingobacteriales bacterium]
MKPKILTAAYGSAKTPLKLGELEIPCYVLEDGTRVLSGRGIQKSLKAPENASGTWLAKFLGSDAIRAHLNPSVLEKLDNPIKFHRPGPSSAQPITYGYEATLLIDICNAILEANVPSGKINPIQVKSAEIIIRSVAKVGIIALVDEVTGYQKKRDEDALQRFLQKFLEDEKGKWVRTFPPEFFEAIFKMKGWTWKEASTKKPQVVGHYINNYVYSRLAPKVLTELRELNPKNEKGNRKGKYPQWINPDYGHPLLKERLNTLTAFARAAGFNWNNWERMVKRAFPKFEDDGSQKLELPFKDEE